MTVKLYFPCEDEYLLLEGEDKEINAVTTQQQLLEANKLCWILYIN